MQKLLFTVMLVTGITLQDYAQSNDDLSAVFELHNSPFHRKFTFDLGKENKMQIETYDLNDLAYLIHPDSIVHIFISDMEDLKDSLQPDVASRTIEYAIDGPDAKRISISRHAVMKSNFLLSHKQLTELKVVQDTLIIYGIVPKQGSGSKRNTLHYFRISFFLNDVNELSRYKGTLDERINRLYTSVREPWTIGYYGSMHLKGQPDISASRPRGNMGGGYFLSVRPSIDVQNYKNIFMPSASSGFAIVTDKNLVHQEYYFGDEMHSAFKRNNDKLQMYANHFIVVSYGRGKINSYTGKTSNLYPFMSLAYLISRHGDVFDKHSLRLGLAQLNLFGNYTKVEPCFYFHDFFQGITPSLRVTQHF